MGYAPARGSQRFGGILFTHFARPITLVAATLTLVMPFVGIAGSGLGPSLASTVGGAQAPAWSVPIHVVSSPVTPLLSLAATRAASISVLSTTLSANGIERDAAAVIAAAAALVAAAQAAAAQAAALAAAQAAAIAAAQAAAAQAATAPTVTTRVVAGRTVRVISRAAAASTASVPTATAAGDCEASPGGGGSAPGRTSAGGVAGTTTGDIQSFSSTYNSIRAANCVQPVPVANFRYDSCMETRLFWIAEDPSADPNSAWGHIGTARSDGAPSVGCDGNLAGGAGNTGATVAQKWWASADHRTSLYRPAFAGDTAGVCIYFAMTHGGLPSDGYGYTRAAARWGAC
jgi:hypothetical protein